MGRSVDQVIASLPQARRRKVLPKSREIAVEMAKPEAIAQLVFLIRGEKVLLDSDLAMLYDVETGALNRAVKRNINRFPVDFMFQTTAQEWEELRCQIGISNSSKTTATRSALRPKPPAAKIRGGARYRPYAFTEHGVAMLSSVVRSPRAAESISPSCAPLFSCAA